MKDLLKTGQVLGRSEMKMIMAGSSDAECAKVCYDIWKACAAAASGMNAATQEACQKQGGACLGTCYGGMTGLMYSSSL